MLTKTIITSLVLAFCRGHLAHLSAPHQIQPVHSLYIQPSPDGTTADLYVAASEDNGNVEWLSDQPIKFLPAATASKPSTALPLSFASSLTKTSTPIEEKLIPTEKRAVVTSPPMPYAYAATVPAALDGIPLPYPYAVPAFAPQKTKETVPQCPEGTTATLPSVPLYPMHYFYPQMMSAALSNVNIFKEGIGGKDDVTTSALSQAMAMWPPTTYAFPIPYMMMDPNAWAENHAISSSTDSSSSQTTKEKNDS